MKRICTRLPLVWLLAAAAPAAALEPSAAAVLQIPEPTMQPGDKCTVVQGKQISTRTVELRRTFLEDFTSFEVSNTGRPGVWQSHFPFSRADYWMGRTLVGNREQQLYVDDHYRPQNVGLTPRHPFSVSNGILTVTAKREDKPIGPFKDVAGKDHYFTYTSGIISSFKKFSQKYGYFEVRAKLPLSRALWSGLWMLRADVIQWPPEIDVIEINNRAPERPRNQGTNAMHSKIDGKLVSNNCYIDVAGADSEFHTYGVLWTPEKVVYYRDRIPVTVSKTPEDMHSPMYLLLQLAVGPHVNAETPATVTLEADWISAYALP